MSQGPPRRPRVFEAEDPSVMPSPPPDRQQARGEEEDAGQHRMSLEDEVEAVLDEEPRADVRDEAGTPRSRRVAGVEQPPAARRGWLGWGSVFLGAVGSLILLALGLWVADFLTGMVARDDVLGCTARGLAGVAAVALVVIVLKELFGYLRLARLTGLRRDAEAALRQNDMKRARAAVDRLKAIAGSSRDKRWDLARFRDSERHRRDAAGLLGLADSVLLAGPDAEARRIVYQSARRVGVVAAVVPVAFIVVGFVLFENLRMARRLAGVYGGQPGFLGSVRLFGWIIGHIAASGAIALTDDLWGQFFGVDALRRVSARLGEGAFNAAMTARLGVAAISICRPLPFIEVKAPRARHIFYEAFPDMRPSAVAQKVWGGGRSSARERGGADNA